MSVSVIKRDGRLDEFKEEKIFNAVRKAFDASDTPYTSKEITKIVNYVKQNVFIGDSEVEIPVEELQNEIEKAIIAKGYIEVAREYITYRDGRSKSRTNKSFLMSTIREILDGDLKSSNTLRDNGNINGATPASAMYKVGSEANKTYNLLNCMKVEYSKAHKAGDIHIHDLDYYKLTANCLFIPIGKLLARGFNPGQGSVRRAGSIGTAAALTAVIIQSSQNQMFGGQAADNLEFDLAPYVDETFKGFVEEEVKSYFRYAGVIDQSLHIQEVQKYYADLLSYEDPDIDFMYDQGELPLHVVNEIIKGAREKTERATFQAMEGLIHNLNTLMSRAGNQIPFSSINYGLDTSQCGRLVTRCILQAVDNGLGHGETAIFPISIMKMMDGINVEDTDPNRDLWKFGVKVLCHRFYPNFVSVDAPFNKKYVKYDYFTLAFKPQDMVFARKIGTRDGIACKFDSLKIELDALGELTDFELFDKTKNKWLQITDIKCDMVHLRKLKPETTVAAMGCRTRVIGNINGPEQTTGRGNFAFTTLNLPAMAIRAVRSSTNPEVQIENFWKDLDDKLRISANCLMDRFEIISHKTYRNFPFLMQNGVYLTSDEREWTVDTEVGEVLKQSTLSIGYIGIYETCKVLLNKVLGVDEEAQEFGLKIVKYIREYCNKLQEKTHLNWSTFATPAENLCGRFATIDKKRYGEIKDITDKGYYTNSHMLPFDLDTTLINKIKTESPFHDLTNAGHIFYYKVDGDPSQNLEAVEKIIMSMYKGNLGYFTITMDVDECPECGYHGIIGDACPHCGLKDNGNNITRIRRITGYLVGKPNVSVYESWNDGKLAELKRRKNI